jgi:hypothetical protein
LGNFVWVARISKPAIITIVRYQARGKVRVKDEPPSLNRGGEKSARVYLSWSRAVGGMKKLAVMHGAQSPLVAFTGSGGRMTKGTAKLAALVLEVAPGVGM